MPTTQIPICVTSLMRPLIPSLDVCAFIIIVDTDNESKPIPIIKIKNINMTLLILFIDILLIYTHYFCFNGKIVAITATAHFCFVCLFLFGVSFPILALKNAFQH
jgi:hypothetical protein